MKLPESEGHTLRLLSMRQSNKCKHTQLSRILHLGKGNSNRVVTRSYWSSKLEKVRDLQTSGKAV